MSYQVSQEGEGLLEACPAVTAAEGLLCAVDPPLLPRSGVGWEGFPVLTALPQLLLAGGALVLEEASGGWVILFSLSAYTGLL